MLCPACVAENPEEDLFCENCGLKLGEAPEPEGAAPAACLCEALDDDGYCLSCGRLARRAHSPEAEPPRPPDPSDHIELSLSPAFAAVSDRGQRHAKNEDRFGICSSGAACAIVVCDGVSTSSSAEIASASVVEGALESLANALAGAAPADPAAAIRQAILAGAARLASRASTEPSGNPPSTTVVAALVAEGQATLGWLGDSRAYWIDLESSPANPPKATQLTQDHSWLNAVVGAHRLTPEQAERSPQAHAITRWIGADAPEDLEIDIVRHPIPTAANGILLLCTDGLWNYFPTPDAMAAIVQNAIHSGQNAGQNASQNASQKASQVGGQIVPGALGLARQLVDLANRRGGHDNITAAVLRFGPLETANGPETAQKAIENPQ